MAGHLDEGLPARDVSWGEALRAPFNALAAGDASALEAVWEIASRRLYGLALWRTGCEEDARDVVQEVFVRLASRRAELGRVARPDVWLLAVTHNAAIDTARRKVRRRTEPLESASHVAAPGADPERAAAARAASDALARLVPAQREAVLLHHVAGCSFREIGAITGVPAFTAASRCRLALAQPPPAHGSNPMNDDPVLRGFTSPAVPNGLREAALAAAREAFAAPVRPDVWTRLLATPAARLAWAASVAVLAAANVLLPQSRGDRTSGASSATARPDPELAAVTRLPRLDEHSLPTLEGGRS